MVTREYKNTNESVSLLGFGCMRLPFKGSMGEIDKEKAQAMVDYAISQGINYFDTAYMYHEGRSESFVGEALARHGRECFNLASKMPLVFVSSEEDVERIFQEQLSRCRVDYFDYYLLHNVNEAHARKIDTFGIYEKMKAKQRQGKIRRLGFSFHDRPEILARLTERYAWDFAQIQLNYMDWELQKASQQYQILSDKGIPVVVMEPLRGGALATLSETALQVLKAARPEASAASWGIRFAASLPQVLVVLSGMSSMEQLVDNINTMQDFRPLSQAEYAVIAEALAAYRVSATIPCTACRYCMDCPSGVDIPRTLAIYNNYLIRKSQSNPMSEMLFEMEANILGRDKLPKHCVRCYQCSEHCPQHIDIPQWMERIAAKCSF